MSPDPIVRLPEVPNAAALFLERAARAPEAPALRTFVGGAGVGADTGRTLTWGAWEARSRAFARRLAAEGIRPGDRIAIWGGSRPLWPIADLGALLAGVVPVGLYPSSAPAQVRTLLADAGAVAAVADTPERAALFRELAGELPGLRLVLDEAEVDPGASEAGEREGTRGRTRGDAEGLPGSDDFPGLAAAPADDALLIYTSGSTGEPRGARISHRYLLASAASIRQALGLEEGGLTLSFLPYCHAAERVFGLYTRILCGMEAVLVEDHRQVWEAARSVHPTLFGGLPRSYEKVYEAMRAHQEEGGDPRELAPRFFGDRLELATSGGATLPAEVSRYLARVGVPVLGAYGLTEHLCAAMNRPKRHDLETSGPPMPGTELRIAGDGEILLRRGPLTFSGYLNRDEETARSFSPDEEWLLTGDLGRLDEHGFLRVTGRKKELLALSTGKKVAPLPVEARLVQHPWISQAVLVGEGRKFVGALLVLSRPVVEAWARSQGLTEPWEALVRHPRVRVQLDDAVARVNRSLSRTEQVRRYRILEGEFTQEAGELTPTLKVRREAVLERHAPEVEALYAEAESEPTTEPTTEEVP